MATHHELDRSISLIISGGVVRADELNMTGNSAVANYRTLRVDTAFIGLGGLNVGAGPTDYNL